MSDVNIFVSDWEPIIRIVVVGTLMYLTLVVLLRLSGSRTLASMSAFDFIVTVAIGAVFGRALTARSVALTEAVTAFVLLVGLQFAVAWLQTRWPFFMSTVTNPPVLLYFQGEFLRPAMRRQRVTEAELHSAVRKKKFGSMAEVEVIILESSGEISVIGTIGDGSALGKEIHQQLSEQHGDHQ